MSKTQILLLGAGGHAKSCIDVIEQDGHFAIAGLVGVAQEVGAKILGYSVLGTDADLPNLLREYKHALVTVGQIKTPDPRIKLFELARQHDAIFPTIISPRAYVSLHAKLGAGTIVMHGAIVNTGTVVGNNCIINSKALLEHDVLVGDHCHIATAAVLNGSVSVGNKTFIGSNSSVKQNIKIGEGCVIGMGQTVLKDLS